MRLIISSILAIVLFLINVQGSVHAQFTLKSKDADKLCAFKNNALCKQCFEAGKAWTAIGCIDSNFTAFFSTLIKLGSSIAGGIAFFLIILGGIQMMTAAGNPERLNAGKELISAAVTGLLFIIFSVFILRFISVDMLGIPEFGK